MQPIIDEVISSIQINNIVDIGCGSGDKINRYVEKYNINGLGIDKSEESITLAKSKAANLDITKKARFICADILEILNGNKIYPEIDCILSFMTFHDLIDNKENDAHNILQKLKNTFPNAKEFLIGDSFASENYNQSEIFTLGFELVHKLRDIEIFSVKDYKDFFLSNNFTIKKQISLNIPNTFLFHLSC